MKSLNSRQKRSLIRYAIRHLPGNSNNSNPVSKIIDDVFSAGRQAVRNITGFRQRNSRRGIRFQNLNARSKTSNIPVPSINMPAQTRYLEFQDVLQIDTDSSLIFKNANSNIYQLFYGINTSDQFKALLQDTIVWRPIAAKITLTSAIRSPVVVDNTDNIQHSLILPNIYFQTYTTTTALSADYMLNNKPSFMWNPNKRETSFVIKYNDKLLIQPNYIGAWMRPSTSQAGRAQTINLLAQSDLLAPGTLSNKIDIALVTIQYKLLTYVHDVKLTTNQAKEIDQINTEKYRLNNIDQYIDTIRYKDRNFSPKTNIKDEINRLGALVELNNNKHNLRNKKLLDNQVDLIFSPENALPSEEEDDSEKNNADGCNENAH